MMKKTPPALLLLLVLAAASGCAPAAVAPAPSAGHPQGPPAEQRLAVERAVLDYVEGFYRADSTLFARSISPRVFKYGYWRQEPAGPFTSEALPFADFMQVARSVQRSYAHLSRPRAEVVVFDVQDQTASAKLTAEWGTDYLLLGRENGRWMITHVLWQTLDD
jgi:hypothetical protein